MSAALRLPPPPARRGACPSVAAPMPTGDGLLVRLRPRAAGLSPARWRAIAALARRHGNGLVEVTARGNLQIRGLTAGTALLLSDGLDTAGIALRSGVAIEVPPLAGRDPSEAADATPLAGAIEAALAARPLLLAPKLAVVVDGGGVLSLADMVADLRLDAERTADGVAWRISIAGDAFSARPVARTDASGAVGKAVELLGLLAALGPAARGRDLGEALAPTLAGPFARPPLPAAPVGPIAIGGGHVLGLRLPYGQIHADRLEALAGDLERLGAAEIRLAPHRALLVPGLDGENLAAARRAAAAQGFWIDPEAPGNAISACAGSAGCASGLVDTHAVADMLVAAAPSLFDGATGVHVSGCAKGCAHPAAAALTLIGSARGLGLVACGRAGDEPLAVTDDPASAFIRLEALLSRERALGETFHSLLGRLGKGRLKAAFQGRT